MQEHPLDPGWENGSYYKCHEKFRAKADIGTGVLDVVIKDGKPAVRSAFVIRGAKGVGYSRILYFDDFYFADGEPIELPDPRARIQYRCMKLGNWEKKYDLSSPWDRVVEQYTSYKKGQKPASIDLEPWNNMIAEASEIRKNRNKGKCSPLPARQRCR